jgi:hypothetical protein
LPILVTPLPVPTPTFSANSPAPRQEKRDLTLEPLPNS